MPALGALDLDAVLALQRAPELAPAMRALTALGSEGCYLLTLPALAFGLAPKPAYRGAVALLVAHALGTLCKLAAATPRPYWLAPSVLALSTERSFSMPSGHAMNTAAVALTLAAGLGGARSRTRASALALGFVALVGLSRVHLGVHFPSDVLAGALLGALVYAGLERERRTGVVSARLARAPLPVSFALAGGAAALWFGLAYALARHGRGASYDPALLARWLGHGLGPRGADGPLSLEPLAGAAGALAGLGAGLAAGARTGAFEPPPREPSKRLARVALGLAGLAGCYLGLRYALPHGHGARGLAARALRYALSLLWVTALAPWALRRVGLAGPRAAP